MGVQQINRCAAGNGAAKGNGADSFLAVMILTRARSLQLSALFIEDFKTFSTHFFNSRAGAVDRSNAQGSKFRVVPSRLYAACISTRENRTIEGDLWRRAR